MSRLFLFLVLVFTALHGEEGAPAPAMKQLIIIDPGHGGKDEGTTKKTLLEKRLTLRTALMTKKKLQALGYRVFLTRNRDVDLALHERAHLANDKGGALFVSIHFNSAPSPEAKGIEIYYPTRGDRDRLRDSKRFANYVLYHLLQETEASSRGVRVGNFHVIRETHMPAILVEGGFMTNPDERKRLRTKEYLEKIAQGIAAGVDKYFKN